MRSLRAATAAFACALALASAGAGGGAQPSPGFVRPGRSEKCPVCGMLVSKYPDWVAELVFSDGGHEVFDGAKDLLRYWLDMRAFGGARAQRDVAAAFVTDYYALEPVDARSAHYVVGSDVYGPMGRELIPFAKRADAEEFLRDHGGRKIVAFAEAAAELPALLE